uniref:Pentacotripeptide-repeat region of PRORP domain-containing protein n=1 Tax=Globisporangium ultimum (strain ATCC 200006 / CBS 805.95 / DAOM BR144) TaxID=431595 RepID=K3WY47_GLOUD
MAHITAHLRPLLRLRAALTVLPLPLSPASALAGSRSAAAPLRANVSGALAAPYSSQRKPSAPGGATSKPKFGNGKMDLRFQRDHERKQHQQRFQIQMSKTQCWMEHRAKAGDFAAIVQSIADCYEPLFRKHPALADATCSLNALLKGGALTSNSGGDDDDVIDNEDDDEVVVTTTRGPKPRYQDGRTKMMEQLAMELLFKGRRSDLAVAIYENRRSVGQTIADSGLERNDREQRMVTEHYRSFFSMAAGAYAALNQHEQVVEVYEDAIEAQLWPTVSMNVNYVRALTTLWRFDDVDTAYRVINATDGFQNIFFYRCMLLYTSVSGNTSVLLDVLTKMKEQQFALRAIDYQRCIRAFDGSLHKAASASPSTYSEYVQAMHNADADDDGNGNEGEDVEDESATFLDEDEESSAHAVLFLFDQMCASEVEITEEIGKMLYPRVLMAAIKLRDFDRVLSIVTTRRQNVNAPLGEDGLQLAVTGLLLGDRPENAWQLVTQEYEHTSPRPRAHAIVVANLLEYLCLKKRVALILEILGDLKRRSTAYHGIVSNANVRAVIDALCAADPEIMDDEKLFAAISEFDFVFRVLDKPFWFTYFLTSCHAHGRLDAAKDSFRARNAHEIPTIPISLALVLMRSYAEQSDFEFVHRVFQTVNLQSEKPSVADKCEACYAAMRACAKVEWLGEDEIRQIYATHLQTLIADESQLPGDIKSLITAP